MANTLHSPTRTYVYIVPKLHCFMFCCALIVVTSANGSSVEQVSQSFWWGFLATTIQLLLPQAI